MTSITAKEGFLYPKKLWDPLSRLWENLRNPLSKKETMSAVIPKPQLRGFLRRDTYRTFLYATLAGTLSAVAWQVWFVIPRQAAEKEFFKNYEIERQKEREREREREKQKQKKK